MLTWSFVGSEAGTAMEPLALLPELCLVAGALVALVGGSFLPRRRQWIARLVAVMALVSAAVASAWALTGVGREVYTGTFSVDTASGVARLIVVAATLLVIGLGVDELAGAGRESETYALLLLSACGAMLLGGAHDLLVLAVAFLLTSVPLYGLIGMCGTPRAAEAAMKTYLLGALFGIGLLLGTAVLSGLAHGTAYGELSAALTSAPPAAVAFGAVAVLGGLLFEAGAVPAHFWVPDAAQGSTTTVAAYLTTVPKIGALVAAYRLVEVLPPTVSWSVLVGVLAVAGMTLANFAAFTQDDPARLLGWSTVSQVGYLLIPVAVAGSSPLALPALLVYLAGYAVTNLGAFSVVAALPGRRGLMDYRGVGHRWPALGAALFVCLLGLVGTPPAAVFAGKVVVAAAGWDAGAPWLAVALVANSVVSLFYYLRWIAPLYRAGASGTPGTPGTPGTGDPGLPRPWAARAAVTAASASVLLGLVSGLVWSVSAA